MDAAVIEFGKPRISLSTFRTFWFLIFLRGPTLGRRPAPRERVVSQC